MIMADCLLNTVAFLMFLSCMWMVMGEHIREDRFTSIDIQNVINGPRAGECAALFIYRRKRSLINNQMIADHKKDKVTADMRLLWIRRICSETYLRFAWQMESQSITYQNQ